MTSLPTRPTDHHDVSLAVPRRWTTRADPGRGIVLVARSPVVPAGGFVPVLVLRTSPAQPPDPPDDAEVEDEDAFDLGGRPVSYARLAHRVGPTDVVSERWTWVLGDTAVSLTGSVARADYEDYCDVFEDVAATVEISSAGPPGSARHDGGRW